MKVFLFVATLGYSRRLHVRAYGHARQESDGNAYSVSWRLIGERVRVTVGGGSVRVLHGGREVAVHAELKGRRGRAVDEAHLAGVVGTKQRPIRLIEVPPSEAAPTLLRPLAEYEAVVGGGF